MANFGLRSKRELATIDPRLVTVLERTIDLYDFSVYCGKRGKEKQMEYLATGASHAAWPDSAHNCAIPEHDVERILWREDPDGLSKAVDIVPWPIDWKDLRRFCYLAGLVMGISEELGIAVRWGGDWDRDGRLNWRDPDNSFNDLPHFELVL